ncbi:hypothetical protein MF271_22610 (plasmid) [Deinococcus sp. KNUC1210]|uniref:hypothetical protein n=1 Tax=Deinococcus sp. KNUC1210 TaxID=2917691 RepID=UPI001EF04567|nr:hypothetical protein [Deinococcus sp. KNUC1210]ULH18260.1 hypothetical protein MF271_22610 [Deinococcus sp. KNUC1210]
MTREAFEGEIQQLIGLQLKGIRYYELQGDWPHWNGDSEFDSLDCGLDLVGEHATYCITWDWTFWSYGLRVRPGRLVDFLLGGQFTDVSAESRWSKLLGQRVTQAQLMWEPLPDPCIEQTAAYPQGLVLRFEAGDQVYISASQPQGPHEPFLGMSDHVVVLFETALAQRYLNLNRVQLGFE